MFDFHRQLKYLQRYFAVKSRLYIALSVLGALLLIFLLRGCSASSLIEIDYRIGQDSRWDSLNLMGKELNVTAFNNELLLAIAKQENLRLHLAVLPANELIEDLENGELQGILTNLKSDYSTYNRFVFSEPYFFLGPVLIISSADPLKGWNEKAKKIVAVPANSTALINLEQDPTIQIRLYDDILRALADLDDQRIDGAVFPAIQAHTYTHTFYKGRLKVATAPLTDEGLRLMALKNPKGELLIQRFNEGFAKLKKEGIYDSLLEEWGLTDVEKFDP